jgi:hypothetical protein
MTAGASVLLVVIGGSTAVIAAVTENEPRIVTAVGAGHPAAAAPAERVADPQAPHPPAAAGLGADPEVEHPIRRTLDDAADRTATRAPRTDEGRAAAAPAAEPKPAAPLPDRKPAVVTRTVTEKRAIPYRTRLIRDPSLPRGRKQVQTEGIPGEQTRRWLVTYSDGRPTDRRLIDATVTRQPQHRVVAFGTRRGKGDGPRGCRPGSDHCFPIGRSAQCPDEKAPESGTLGVLGHDFYLLTPEDLSGLELDPGMLC